MTDTTNPPPKPPETGHKAWWGAAVAALMTAVMATYAASSADFATLWDGLWCAMFSSLACPADGAIPMALKSIGASLLDQWWKALMIAGVVQQVVYRVTNRAK